MALNTPCSSVSVFLCCILLNPGFNYAQEASQPAQPNAVQKYKLTILESPGTSKRVKKGRVSAEAVVQVTDTNNVPVPGITVTFLLPQYGSGATFGSGALSSVVTTNASGIATSGSLSMTAGSSVSLSVSAAVPGGMLTGTVPISAAAVAAGAGISTVLIVAITVAAVAGGVAVAATSGGFSSKSGGSSSTSAVSVTIGSPSAGGITFGPPK
jgi:hypothetical protein